MSDQSRVMVTVSLELEQVEAIDALCAMDTRPRDRDKEIRGLLWSALLRSPPKIGTAAWEKFTERTAVARLKGHVK